MGGNQESTSRPGRNFINASPSRFMGFMKQLIKSLKVERSGQELVEFAIIIPLLMIIAFGVLDLGRGFHAVISITNVAREGARYGVDFNWKDPDLTDPLATGYTEIIDVAFLEADISRLDLDNLNVTAVCSNIVLGKCQEDSRLKVTATYDFEFILSFFPNFSMTRFTTMMIP